MTSGNNGFGPRPWRRKEQRPEGVFTIYKNESVRRTRSGEKGTPMRFALVFSIHASPLSGGLEQARNYRLPFKTFNFPLSGKFSDRVAFMQTSYFPCSSWSKGNRRCLHAG